jgi:hypothetical protein
LATAAVTAPMMMKGQPQLLHQRVSHQIMAAPAVFFLQPKKKETTSFQVQYVFGEVHYPPLRTVDNIPGS